MTLCDDGHEEICYEGRNCPVCEFKLQLEDLEQIISDKDQELQKLSNRIDELESKETE